MKTAYRIPDTPGANVRPGETGYPTVPINRMVPRSFAHQRQGRRFGEGRRLALCARYCVRGLIAE